MSTICLPVSESESYTALVMTTETQPRSLVVQFRTTPGFKRILEAVAREFAGSQTAAIEYLVREHARKNRLKVTIAETASAAVSETKTAYSVAPASEATGEGK